MTPKEFHLTQLTNLVYGGPVSQQKEHGLVRQPHFAS